MFKILFVSRYTTLYFFFLNHFVDVELTYNELHIFKRYNLINFDISYLLVKSPQPK